LLPASNNPAIGRGSVHHRRRWLILAGLLGILAGQALGVLIGVRIGEGRPDREARSMSQMLGRIEMLESRAGTQPDWTAIAQAAQPSIFTISTQTEEGSAWTVRSSASGSDLITNFHVVASAWQAGDVALHVQQGDRIVDGTITRVDQADDLAVIHIAARRTALRVAAGRPKLGEAVMAVGAPLGLGGSVSVGVVSGFRSLGGSDYIQFSAPISPGNSGGPVLDSQGHVVAVAAAKLVGDGVEAISLSVPVQTVCQVVVACPPA
jgi:putative serine protease PepD